MYRKINRNGLVGARILTVAAVAMLAASAMVMGLEDLETRMEVQALLDQVAAAVDAGNFDAVIATALPDAMIQYADGSRITLEQWKTEHAAMAGRIKKMTSKFVLNQVLPAGEGEFLATYDEIHDSIETDPADGQDHAFRYQGSWDATLRFTDQGWRFITLHERTQTITRDGQPWPAATPAP